MPEDANPAEGPSLVDDERALARHADALGRAVEAALPGWVERVVADRLVAWQGIAPGPVVDEARAAGARAAADVGPTLRRLLALDIAEQWTNPLAIVRTAVRYPTEVLREAGVPPVVRDEMATAQFPDDDYDLVPGSFADVDPSLHEPGLVWGAAKAHVHLRRRREQGR